MPYYLVTFKDGHKVQVIANDEAEARNKAVARLYAMQKMSGTQGFQVRNVQRTGRGQ